ncbi:MAG: dihydrodipicolinate synthase family protein [Planctomycetes bacterium]|nr:dihydrodipicolinate synthase family protein [Planctomycetota bacterium]
MSRRIESVLPILHTPWTPDDQIDFTSLRRQIDWCFELGAHGIASAMVSELLRMTPHERNELARAMVSIADGRGVVIASVGAESTRQALELAEGARDAGCDAIMAIPPISTPLPDEALLRYFGTLADKIDLPLVVQDASSYVGQSMSISFFARLLEKYGPEKILFKPEAAPIGPNLSALRDATGGRAKIFEGSGGILLVDSYRRGIAGTMPGVDLLDGVIALWNALEAGDEEASYRLYFPICAIVALQIQAGLDGFLAIEKYILFKRGLFASERRREPYSWSLDDETRAEVDRLLEHLAQALQPDPLG